MLEYIIVPEKRPNPFLLSQAIFFSKQKTDSKRTNQKIDTLVSIP